MRLARRLPRFRLPTVVGPGSSPTIRKELLVDELDQVVAGQRVIVIEGAVLLLGGSPFTPAILALDDVGVRLSREFSLLLPVILQVVEGFEEQHPGGLLGIVEFRRAAGLLPENVVDILEGLFEHSRPDLNGNSVATQ